jgi:hypothetical protein
MKPRIRPPLLAGAIVGALMIFGPGSAPAGSVDLATTGTGGGPLRLYAGPGEDNHVTVGLDSAGAAYVVTDSAGIPSASASCAQISATAASCPASLVSSIQVELGDGSDSFRVVGGGVGVPLSVSR